jgi:hypothetical protein
MAGFRTFEGWKNYKFMLEGQESNSRKKNPLPIPSSIKTTDIPKTELRKIRKEQKDIARVYINNFLIKGKKSFQKALKLSRNKVNLVESATQELENVLHGELSKDYKLVVVSTFDMILPASRVKKVQEYYYHNYVIGKNVNYDFISPEHPFQLANKRSIALFCQALYELKLWIEKINVKRILELEEKRKKNGSFQVALYFADGTIYKILEKLDNAKKCAEKLNVLKSRAYISESVKLESTSRKSIFNLPALIQDTIEYCDFHGITLNAKFIADCIKKNVYPK